MWTHRQLATAVAAIAVTAAACLTACGDSGDAGPTAPFAGEVQGTGVIGNAGDATGGDSNGGDSNGGDSNGGDSNGGGGSSDSAGGFDWPVFGPGDPTSPTPDWPIYNAFAHGDCAALRSADHGSIADLYQALVALCAAAVEHNSGQWATARDAFARVGDEQLTVPCMAPLLVGALQRGLAWHAEHPDSNPDVHFPVADDLTPCGSESDALFNGGGATTTDPSTDDTSSEEATTEPTTDTSG